MANELVRTQANCTLYEVEDTLVTNTIDLAPG